MILLARVVCLGYNLIKLLPLALPAIHPSGGTIRGGGSAGGREAGGPAGARGAGRDRSKLSCDYHYFRNW